MDGSMLRRAAALVLAAAVVASAARAAPADHPPSARQSIDASALQLSRIVSARVHHTRISTARNLNARGVGRALAGLRPTWVTGLIRYAKGQHPNGAEVHAWRQITRIVRLANPGVQFDVTLNADQYLNGRELRKMMHRVRKRLDNDGWFFDFYSTAFRERPRMIRGAIANAHAHDEWIGGNVFGLRRRAPVPVRSDFVSVQDFRSFDLNRPAIRRLARHVPVVYHVNNNPAHSRSGGCRFIESFNSARRRNLIRHRAKQQGGYGFRVSYPAFFPECFRDRPGRGNGHFLYSYNVFRDPPVRKAVRHLLNRYDGV
jgi:hypothetical protein